MGFRQRHGHWFGLAGVHEHETAAARRWFRRFEWVLVPLAIWLPIQFSLESRGDIAPGLARGLDWLIWAAFLIETVVLTVLVTHRRRFLAGNWLNVVIVLAGIPWFWPHLPFLPALRMLMLGTLLVHVASFAAGLLQKNRIGPTIIVILLVTTLGGVLVGQFDPSFTSPWEGIWWAWVTVTTVGYGDFVPQTIAGRVFAVGLMLLGISLIALLSATLVTHFQAEDEREAEVMRRRIIAKLGEMDREAEERQRHVDAMLGALARMEAEALARQAHLEQLHERLGRIEAYLQQRARHGTGSSERPGDRDAG